MALTGDLGMVASQLGDYAEARALFEAVLAQARAQGSRDSVALQLVRLGDLARLDGDYERAARMYAESLALCREIGDVLDIAASLHKLGQVARRRGALAPARELLVESLDIQDAQGNRQGIIEGVAALAGLALEAGQPEHAARMFGAAEALLEGLGAPLAPADQHEWERDVAELKIRLAPETFAAASGAGRTLAAAGAGATAEAALGWVASWPSDRDA
jgi:tetratricopeptide (TPR) repeat protein